MKKIMLAMLLGICSIVWGQTEENVVEFSLKPGETTTWRPFQSCKALRISTQGSAVDALPKPDGKVVIKASKVGRATIIARCGDDVSVKAKVLVSETVATDTTLRRERPATKVFTGTYTFNPPTDHFFVTYIDRGTRNVITRGKIGNEESYNDGTGWDRFWDVKTGENWFFNIQKGWINDVKFDFEPLNTDYAPMNAFAKQANLDSLSNAYIGDEMFHDINCWVFFVQNENGSITRYWVDPSNGCTIKMQVNENEPVEVTNYNLNYKTWDFGPRHKRHQSAGR